MGIIVLVIVVVIAIFAIVQQALGEGAVNALALIFGFLFFLTIFGILSAVFGRRTAILIMLALIGVFVLAILVSVAS